MRKDPLLLMEYTLERAPAAAEHTEPHNLQSAAGWDSWQETGIFGLLTLSGFLAVWLCQFPDIPNAFSFLSIFYLKQLQTCKTWGEREGRKGSVLSHSHIYLYIYLSQPYLYETAVSRALLSVCQTFQKARHIRWALQESLVSSIPMGVPPRWSTSANSLLWQSGFSSVWNSSLTGKAGTRLRSHVSVPLLWASPNPAPSLCLLSPQLMDISDADFDLFEFLCLKSRRPFHI